MVKKRALSLCVRARGEALTPESNVVTIEGMRGSLHVLSLNLRADQKAIPFIYIFLMHLSFRTCYDFKIIPRTKLPSTQCEVAFLKSPEHLQKPNRDRDEGVVRVQTPLSGPHAHPPGTTPNPFPTLPPRQKNKTVP